MANLYGEIGSDRGEVHKIGNMYIYSRVQYGSKEHVEGYVTVSLDRLGYAVITTDGKLKVKVFHGKDVVQDL